MDAVCTEYEYDREQYVWPHVNEVGRRSYDVGGGAPFQLEHLVSEPSCGRTLPLTSP